MEGEFVLGLFGSSQRVPPFMEGPIDMLVEQALETDATVKRKTINRCAEPSCVAAPESLVPITNLSWRLRRCS
jgi:hypothetical protein